MGNVLELSHWRGEENPDRISYKGLWQIFPIQGPKIEIHLHRTRYKIKSGNSTYFCETSSTLYLFSKDQFEYQLEFLFPDKPYSRLVLSLVTGAAFLINGVEAERVYIHQGDQVKIGYNYFNFPKTSQQNVSKTENVFETSIEIIQSKLPIYLEGETGTGKTTMAKKIHDMSGAVGNFVHLNLSSISTNLFESELFGHKKGAFTGAFADKSGVIREAHQGTLFLDEINSLPIELQTKLLLVLESQSLRPVGGTNEVKSDFRLITSSNEKIEDLLVSKRMRKDFYFRITSGEKIQLPNLNSSEAYFYDVLTKLENELDIIIPRSLKDFYFNIKWEGNIRQLKSYLLKKKVVQGKKIYYSATDESLVDKDTVTVKESDSKSLVFKTLQEYKINYIRLVFERTGKSVSETAKVLSVAPGTVRAALYD